MSPVLRSATNLLLLAVLLATPTSAAILSVEKDGSGDFTIIQDALDVAQPGDTVMIGPGRFEDFRPATTLDGFDFASIAHIKTPDLSVIGAGKDLTYLGPETNVEDVDGLNATGIVVDEVSGVVVEALTIENEQFPVSIKFQSRLTRCRIRNTGSNFGLSVLQGDQVEISECEFEGPQAVITGSPSVTGLRILDSTFENLELTRTAVVIGNGSTDAYIKNCVFTGYQSCIETSLSGTAVIEDCVFTQMTVDALDLSSGQMIVRRCRFDAGARFPIRVGAGRPECYDSVIGGGTLTTIAVWGDIVMRNCHLLNGGGLTVDSRGAANRISDLAHN